MTFAFVGYELFFLLVFASSMALGLVALVRAVAGEPAEDAR